MNIYLLELGAATGMTSACDVALPCHAPLSRLRFVGDHRA